MPNSHVSLNSFRKLQSSRHSAIKQHGIRPGHAGLDQLIRVENEILPQHRQADRRADLPQVFEPPLKIRLVGQHADARRAVRLVDLGDCHRIEIGANDARPTGWPSSLRRSA